MKKDVKFICWNYRGAKNKEFIRELREFQRINLPMLIILLEPKISGDEAAEVCKGAGMSHWIRSDVEGFSRGIWLLWNEEKFHLDLIHAHRFFVHVEVADEKGIKWLLTACMPVPDASIQKHMWESLDEMWVEGPWMLVGDFNCILQGGERSSDTGASHSFVE